MILNIDVLPSDSQDVTNSSLEMVIFDSKRNARNIRSKINGLLQNKTRHMTAKFK